MQTVFKRYELKYIITQAQKQMLLDAMAEHMQADKHGKSTVRNIYFDTDNFRLVRHSIEKPIYKEKLRVRTYRQATPDSPVFVELKKKYKSIVYKRRIVLPEQDVMTSFLQNTPLPAESQIGDEIQYFRTYYGTLQPRVFLSYQREAYYDKNDPEFRVTFDGEILYRTDNLSLQEPPYGTAILPPDKALMEIKTAGAIPLWLCHILTEQHIYKTSFSKYGTAYRDMTTKKGVICYV